MTNQPPLLPETTFAPLSQAKLSEMIDHAVTYRQLPRTAQVISFPQKLAYTGGLTAMAASIMLAFMFTPQYTATVTAASGTDIAVNTSDMSYLLLLETFGA